ncbi:MAG TPA: DciA family protein [Nocardioidaceae bacterium]|nr:DciA family protein [Nocardioidaceae bacterium]
MSTDQPADESVEQPVPPAGQPGAPTVAPTVGPAVGPPHDPTGSDLARAVASAYRGVARRRTSRGALRGATRVAPQASGAGPDDRDPQTVSRAMSRLVAEHGWTTELAVHGVFGRWETIVGAEVAAHCRPERFVDGRLAVRADSTAWATQVRLLAPMVVQRLNDEIGDGTVTRLEVAGPQQPSWRHGRFAVPDARGPRDTYG